MNCDVRVNGGWGWVVVASFAMSNFVMAAIFRLFGIFFAALVEEFHGSASFTSFAFGLRLCLSTFAVPFAIYFSDRFSERPVIMTGAAIYCVSFALIFPAPNLLYVVIFVGINGIGTGLVVTSFLAIIGKYFEKRTSLSTMLSFAGSSLGQITLPHLILYLLREYGLRGMIMIYGGILFHIAVFASLIRPLPRTTKDTGSRNIRRDLPASKNITSGDVEQSSELELCLTPKNELLLENKSDEKLKYPNIIQTSTGSLILRSMSSIVDEPDFASGWSSTTTQERNTHRPASVKAKAILLMIFDATLIKDARFCLFIIASGLSSAGFLCEITYLVPWSIERGHSLDSAALLLSIAGGAEFIGRLIMGFLGDWKPIGPVKVMIIYAALIGTGNILVGFTNAYAGMVAYAVAFGLWGSGGHLSAVPIVGMIFDRTKIPSAVGMNMAIQGVVTAGSFALMGLIKDTTGSFQYIFFACAAVRYMVSVLMIATFYLNRRRIKHNNNDGVITDGAAATELVIVGEEDS